MIVEEQTFILQITVYFHKVRTLLIFQKIFAQYQKIKDEYNNLPIPESKIYENVIYSK